jgi:hypothetical protein
MDDPLTGRSEVIELSEVSLARLPQRLVSKHVTLGINGAERLDNPGQLPIQDSLHPEGGFGAQGCKILHGQRASSRREQAEHITCPSRFRIVGPRRGKHGLQFLLGALPELCAMRARLEDDGAGPEGVVNVEVGGQLRVRAAGDEHMRVGPNEGGKEGRYARSAFGPAHVFVEAVDDQEEMPILRSGLGRSPLPELAEGMKIVGRCWGVLSEEMSELVVENAKELRRVGVAETAPEEVRNPIDVVTQGGREVGRQGSLAGPRAADQPAVTLGSTRKAPELIDLRITVKQLRR